MKVFYKLKLAAIALCLGASACSPSEEEEAIVKSQVTKEALQKIYDMGFGKSDVEVVEGGYLIEGDIMLTDEELNSTHDPKFLRVNETEQHRTNNLVSGGTGRTIKVVSSSTLPTTDGTALN